VNADLAGYHIHKIKGLMDINVQELKEKLDRKEGLVLIDVREPHEHETFSVGGRLIPMGNFPAAAQELEAHKDDEIVVYCRSGRRSAAVQQMLEEEGFTNVRNLVGGMLAWQNAFESEKKID